ncbi:hypothetical protein [Stutzerimonas kunmingensis]|uniref:hypothetical protein n=1 Tax=Stutzerimonas kunmingensis TaxID=1211807 RepID=UPI002FC70828
MTRNTRAMFKKIKVWSKLRFRKLFIKSLKRYVPGVAAELGKSALNDDSAVIAHAVANAVDPLGSLNYFSETLRVPEKTLWGALCIIQEARAPAFDRIIHKALLVSSAEVRLQLVIRKTSLEHGVVRVKDLNDLLDEYNGLRMRLANPKAVGATLASLFIDKAPVEEIEALLERAKIDVFSLSEFQKLKLLSRLASAKDLHRFTAWESQLFPVLSQPAKIKVSLMRYGLFGEEKGFFKLEEAFCNIQYDIAKIYSSRFKSIFDSIDVKNNYLDARFDASLIDEVQSVILQKITSRQTFAYMRLGDGESYGFADGQYIDTVGESRQELHWWGEELSEPLRQELQAQFKASLAYANLLGVPSVLRLIRDFNLSKRDEYPSNSLMARLLCVMRGAEPYLHSKIIVEDQSNLFLFDANFVSEIFRSARKVYVVSGLDSNQVKRWSPDNGTFEHIEVPTHRLLRRSDIGASISGIFPNVYSDYIAELSARAEPGVVFLFSAGFIGKILIAEVAKKGAVALDVGQALVSQVVKKNRERV